jgi:hypothetical protein
MTLAKTHAEQRQILEARQKKEAEDLAHEQALREALEAAGAPQPWIVHWRQLYGTQVAFGYGDHHSEEPVTIERAVEICKALPPIGKNYARGRYQYFVAAPATAAFLEEKENAKGFSADEIREYFEVAPWHVRLNNWGTEVKYFTLIGGFIAEITLKVARGPRWGALSFSGHVKHWGQCGPVKSIEGRQVYHDRVPMSGTTVPITDPEGKYLGEFNPPTIYAQGSPDSLGDAKLWAHLGADGQMTVADFLRALYEPREATA